jgi:membrane-associated protein
VNDLLGYFLHVDRHLAELAHSYGAWIYAILFGVVFAETGLVVTPFLPGDSLLFAAGALAGTGVLDIVKVSAVFLAAAVLGDNTNYFIGRTFGPRIFSARQADTFWHRLINRDHLNKAHAFFEKHGALAIVAGHFVPIVRTFVPFVAGAASMTYPKFLAANLAGVLVWVGLCVSGGYWFGQVDVVKNNFSLVAIGIVVVSMLPLLIGYLRARAGANKG